MFQIHCFKINHILSKRRHSKVSFGFFHPFQKEYVAVLEQHLSHSSIIWSFAHTAWSQTQLNTFFYIDQSNPRLRFSKGIIDECILSLNRILP